ncbi:MAG: PQQ-dependent sugar dehydrogenase [Xanthomonadales bacterium]|nr:PQQ-dependent sugar dehydrogenase [Xanthomonadales bacterium]
MRVLGLILICWCSLGVALAQAPANQFLSEIVYDSPNGITALEFDHNGDLLYIEKQGRVMRLPSDGNGGFATPAVLFADLRSQVTSVSEAGLLGLALAPNYASSRWIYLYYSTASDNRLTRITANGTFTAMQAGSEVVLLSGLPGTNRFHSAGDIHFAPGSNSTLLVSLGDNLSANSAQDLDRYEGKILRLNASNGQGLATNPFYDGDPDSIRSRIYAIGFRNPFRWTFHPLASHDQWLYSSENGNSTDRLSFVRRGSNGAWSSAGDGGGFLNPPDPNHRVLATSFPSVVGVAISAAGPFGTDVLYWGQWQGNIRRWQLSGVDLDTASALDGGAYFTTDTSAVDLQFGPDGQLYASTSGGGSSVGGSFPLRRIRYLGTNNFPTAAFSTSPASATGTAPLLVQFVDQSTTPSGTIVSWNWDFGDGATSSAPNPSHTFSNPGIYLVRLTVTNSDAIPAHASKSIRATRTVRVSYAGTIFDARSASSVPLAAATELRFYEADGVTATNLVGALGPPSNILQVPAGGVSGTEVTLKLISDGLVVSAGEPSSDGVLAAKRGWQLAPGEGSQLLHGDYYLASTMISGTLVDTRQAPVIADLGLHRGQGAAATPYPVAGGRDYLPGSGLPPSGVAHRRLSDALGYFHFAIRNGDAATDFRVDAVADTSVNTHAAVDRQTFVSTGTNPQLGMVSGLWSGGQNCDALNGIPVTLAVSYAGQIQPLWDQHCINCHGANASADLDLRAGSSLANLVGVQSDGVPGVPRVTAQRPDRSFLIEKINCMQPQIGTRMPPTGAPLSLAEQALVRDWITQLVVIPGLLFRDGFE